MARRRATGDHWDMTAAASLETVSGPGTLEEIAAELERTWSVHAHVPRNVRVQMTIAVSEIAANIIEHTARPRPVRIQMEINVLPDQMQVIFSDDGQPVSVDVAGVQMPAHTAERGRGLALAQSVLERLAYYRDTLNRWTLISRSFGAA